MQRLIAGVILILAIIFPGIVCAGDSPVVVTHELTKYTKGTKSVTVAYTLHVVNRAAKPISDLTLRVVPARFLRGKTAPLDGGALAPGQAVDLSFELQAPAGMKKEILERQPISLAGRCVDADGTTVEFPVQSRPGGAP